MNSRVAYYLHTDPYFERFEKSCRREGYSFSSISMDEFEETCKSGFYSSWKVTTSLGTVFKVAGDSVNRTILVTCEVPENIVEPLTDEQVQLQDLMRKPH